MNATDLKKLKQWRQYGGLTEDDLERHFVDHPGPFVFSEDAPTHLHEMETNMALALHDFLTVLGVGTSDIEEVLGAENMESINGLLAEEIILVDEKTMAYRVAKALFEPEKPLEDCGFIPIAVEFPEAGWDALEASSDERFVILGPIVLDQNTRTIYMTRAVALDALEPASRLMSEQIVAACQAMREAIR